MSALADAILFLHAAFVLFVILAVPAIAIGHFRRRAWVRNRWFRGAHLVAIAIVVLQAWLGVLCPLTIWENHLREQAGEAGYERGFVAHWVHELLFYDAEPWVFTVIYTAFGLLVVLLLIICPPNWRERKRAR